jgi:hypothetical protein
MNARVGCNLRVIGQPLTDLTRAAFPFAGVSGLLGVPRIALWGTHLWSVTVGRAKSFQPTAWAFTPLPPACAIPPFPESFAFGEETDLETH